MVPSGEQNRPSASAPRRPRLRPATILHLLDTTEYSLHADIHEETTHGAPSPPPRRVPGVPVKNGRTGRHEHARRAHGARGVEVTDAASSCAHPAGDACKTIPPSSDSGGGGARGVAENVSSRPSSSVRNILTSALLTKSRTLRQVPSSQRQSRKCGNEARGYNMAFFVWRLGYCVLGVVAAAAGSRERLPYPIVLRHVSESLEKLSSTV